MHVLVIGGTGPTGPMIVEGLLDRGHKVIVLHGGQHEAEFSRPIEHIHADVHFEAPLKEAIGHRTFDAVIATYGRLGVVSDVLVGHTPRLIAVTGSTVPPDSDDPSYDPGELELAQTEAFVPCLTPTTDSMRRFKYKAYLSEQNMLAHHHAGHYNATILRYSGVYGPTAHANSDWSLVRRILDGRRRLIIADGGLQLHSRVYTLHAAHTVLLAFDQPEASAGQTYNVADERTYSVLQRIRLTALALNHDWELVSMPCELARPFDPICWSKDHRLIDISKIKQELGYRDLVPVREAMDSTVRWLAEHRPEPGGEFERQLADPFDYAAEDAMIEEYLKAKERILAVPFAERGWVHMYRHPKKPNEEWQPSRS